MILTPSAYKQSKGIGVARVSEDSCCWEPSAVGAILDNSAYVGATEGLKSLRVSFKSKKRVPAPKEHRVVVEDTHEPIIDRLVWERCRHSGKTNAAQPKREQPVSFRDCFAVRTAALK